MDAQTPQAEEPKATELSLPQAFLLLATNDTDGAPEVPAYILRTTVAGAILAELELLGAIGLEGKYVRATGTVPPTDFQHQLELIRHKSRPHTPKRWVSMLEGRAEVQRAYEAMASKGIVDRVGEKHLGLFKSVRYPEKDHGPEAALLKKIHDALGLKPSAATPASPPAMATPADAKPADAKPADARTTALIALLEAAGLLDKMFLEADRDVPRKLAKDYWPARAVADELRMIRMAEAEAMT
ncbi:hypothetical protein JOE31_000885 [Arthrobacter sp. PvP023]|uniref:GOLPH3/VPS74 family protein n=1 Tax=Micrococcaceae TaxID=1268 RepID=UPI001AEB9DF4|nr:GPP34 family phosphoprotein [Arthrobacter sp. PvP023]MBP1134653.1 hypothetical protein [Arthrobacter sp. PvP023]